MSSALRGLDAGAARGGATALGPWVGEHLARVVVANALGLVAILASWYATSGSTTTSDALGWLGLGIAGLVVAGVSNGLWLGRARQSITLASVAILATVAGSNGKGVAAPTTALTDAVALVAGAGMSRYHRSDCGLVRNKATTATSRASHERSGRSPCPVCEP
jgi:hypothetical protein